MLKNEQSYKENKKGRLVVVFRSSREELWEHCYTCEHDERAIQLAEIIASYEKDTKAQTGYLRENDYDSGDFKKIIIVKKNKKKIVISKTSDNVVEEVKHDEQKNTNLKQSTEEEKCKININCEEEKISNKCDEKNEVVKLKIEEKVLVVPKKDINLGKFF